MEFLGELFPAEELRKVLSVSELTGQIRALLEKQVGQVWVGGEVTNLRTRGPRARFIFRSSMRRRN